MIQYTQVNKCDTVHKETHGEKSQDHLNDAEKAFDEAQHLLVTKAQEKLGTGRIHLNTTTIRL